MSRWDISDTTMKKIGKFIIFALWATPLSYGLWMHIYAFILVAIITAPYLFVFTTLITEEVGNEDNL